MTKTGKNSYRADSCIKEFRYVVAEFDLISIQEQISFWVQLLQENLPIAAIIHSGGKSLHAWIAVNCTEREEWEREIENKLFPEYLVPLGIDGACKNESRMSRLPGHFRKDRKQYQRLMYLNPNA